MPAAPAQMPPVLRDFLLSLALRLDYPVHMFTIEHEFDATVITLIDEGAARPEALREDVIISAFEDCVTLRQFDPRSGEEMVVTLSTAQLDELAAALNLPEGVYRLGKRAPDQDV